MPKIVFNPSAKTFEANSGASLLDAARLAGVDLEAPCGGVGSCGKCIVRVESGDFDSDNLGILPESAVKEGFVLACKTHVRGSAMTVEVREPIGRYGGKFVDDETADWMIRDGYPSKRRRIDPLVQKICLTVPKPRLEDGLSDLDRLKRSIPKNESGNEIDFPLSVIRSLAKVLRMEDGQVTVTLMRDRACNYAIDIEPGDKTERLFGIAVDIGTTTVAVQLVDLNIGKIVSARTDYNAQISCGLDVISRIQYARDPVRRKELRIRALGTINHLIQKAGQNHDVKRDDIRAAVVSGNTTMIHLLLGLDPEHIRLEPYTPTLHEVPLFTAEEIGIHIHPLSLVLFSPSIGSYVGGDITAGLLCADWTDKADGVHLFMDIGTNGELVIGNREFLIACACSAGPAFEGGGIEFGMRAASGAIERVGIDPTTGAAKIQSIGDGKPVGICGSGMISLLAELLRTGWVDRAGKLDRSRKSPFIRIDGRRARYVLVPETEGGGNDSITISESDIDNVIRAKAAIYSAIRLLLNHVGMGIDQIETIDIAGGFGRFLDLENAMAIGLIPDLPRDKYRYLGNASLTGSYLALVSGEQRKRLFDLSRRMTYVELNTNPDYMHEYTGALFLPHTDINSFPSAERAGGPFRNGSPIKS